MKHEDHETLKMTAEELDARLAARDQIQIARLVKSLPDATPDLVRRSNLNERLFAESKRFQKRRRALWILSPTLGLGVTAAFVFGVLLTHTPQPIAPTNAEMKASPEAALLREHRKEVAQSDVAGVGLSAQEVDDDSASFGIDSDKEDNSSEEL